MTNKLIGKRIEFNARRILKGNPVRGIVISQSKEDVTIKLDHEIEGMVTVWYPGEEKIFSKSLIGEMKII